MWCLQCIANFEKKNWPLHWRNVLSQWLLQLSHVSFQAPTQWPVQQGKVSERIKQGETNIRLLRVALRSFQTYVRDMLKIVGKKATNSFSESIDAQKGDEMGRRWVTPLLWPFSKTKGKSFLRLWAILTQHRSHSSLRCYSRPSDVAQTCESNSLRDSKPAWPLIAQQ